MLGYFPPPPRFLDIFCIFIIVYFPFFFFFFFFFFVYSFLFSFLNVTTHSHHSLFTATRSFCLIFKKFFLFSFLSCVFIFKTPFSLFLISIFVFFLLLPLQVRNHHLFVCVVVAYYHLLGSLACVCSLMEACGWLACSLSLSHTHTHTIPQSPIPALNILSVCANVVQSTSSITQYSYIPPFIRLFLSINISKMYVLAFLSLS